jgi:integrase
VRQAALHKLRSAAASRFSFFGEKRLTQSDGPGRAGQPAASVRGPRHFVTSGQTPVLDPVEARALLDSIDTSTVIGLRDRALIGLMVYSFARIGAALRP